MSEKILESIIFGLKATIAEKDTEIKRLKSENTELYKEHTTVIAGSIKQANEFKAEIARLKFELSAAYDNRVEICKNLAEQKAEIERLTERKDKLQDTKDELEQQLIDTGFKEYCEENKRLTDENSELQKQVDELKERLHMIFALGFDYDGCDKAESLKGLIDELVKITQMDSKEFAEYYKGVEVE